MPDTRIRKIGAHTSFVSTLAACWVVSPTQFSKDDINSDEQDHGHDGYDHRGDGEDLEERPEISRCGNIFGVRFTNVRCIFVKVVEDGSRFSHLSQNNL